jgi:hypothetical protein
LISLSLGNVVFAYVAALVVLLMILWLCGELVRGRREARQRRRCIQCAFCGALYENVTDAPLPACPQCAQPNERFSPPSV